ncbi:MAG TPA: PAS domain S-box protein, partial [Deltaproteobacteria bacterium]|nr:PAS domain S-box protein [Deltaproteobacteria bacterium]
MPTTSDRDPTPPQAILLGTSKLRADGVFVQVSEALAQLSGWSVEGLTDRPLHTILHLSAAEQDALMWALGKATPVVRELAVGSDRASLSWIRATFVRVREPSDPEPLLWMIAEDISARRAQARDHRDQIEALHRTQATVELDLQGTILRANERFLELMGYTEAQVVGQPHRMLVPPEEANSHSYRDFWRRLREGQPQSGQFERVGARSTPIFLQASYTPIRDISGQVYKVVKYASDITQQTLQLRESQESAERYSAEMARVVDALKRGELSVRGDVESQGRTHQAAIAQLNEGLEAIAAPITECLDSLRAMAEGRSPPLPSADHEGDFKLLADSVRTLSQSTSRVAQIASQIADGDLTIKVERRSEEDVLMGALGRMVAALNALLRQVQGSSHQLDQGSAQVQEASQSLANNASRSAASLEEISASMEEIS